MKQVLKTLLKAKLMLNSPDTNFMDAEIFESEIDEAIESISKRDLFLDYFNNYLSIEKFAEHNEIDLESAKIIIEQGRFEHEKYCASIKKGVK